MSDPLEIRTESERKSMRPTKRNSLLIFLLVTTVAVCATLKSISTIDLPGPTGKRFDYLTIDYDDHYLLSAHLAAGLLYVIDLRTNRVVKAIPDVPGAEGVEFVPELKKVYTSNAGDNTIGVIDLKQMKVIKKLPTEAKPDGSAYAAPFHKLYVSDERGKAEAKPSLMLSRTGLSRLCISTVKPGCRNTIQLRARSTSTCRTRTFLR